MLFLWCLALCLGNVVFAARLQNLTTALVDAGHYNNILYFLKKSGLIDQLMQAPAITLFLPDDEALANQPPGVVSDLAHDPQKLREVLEFHCVVGEAVENIYGNDDRLLTSLSKDTIRLDYYRLDKAHRYSLAQGVLVPEKFPVVNGFVHGLATFMKPANGSIVDLVAGRSDMTTLASLVTSAGLVDALNGQNLTLFAPTDAAFAKVNPDVIAFLKNHTNQLKEVLLFHVLGAKEGVIYSKGMGHARTFHSLNKKEDNLFILEDFSSDDIYVNNAMVTEADISATNGVIHVIDTVLIPTQAVMAMEQAGVNLG